MWHLHLKYAWCESEITTTCCINGLKAVDHENVCDVNASNISLVSNKKKNKKRAKKECDLL